MPFLHLAVTRQDSEAPDNKAIERVLDKAKDWYRYAPNCWLIYTGRDAAWWYQKLSEIPAMESDATTFLIGEMLIDQKNKRAGWLKTSTWHWIRKRHDEQKPAEDFNQAAFRVVQQATQNNPADTSVMAKRHKDPNAVALGRKGGKIGGLARAANMTPEQRSEAARKAVQARWAKAKAGTATP
jgi:hypothetical protein